MVPRKFLRLFLQLHNCPFGYTWYYHNTEYFINSHFLRVLMIILSKQHSWIHCMHPQAATIPIAVMHVNSFACDVGDYQIYADFFTIELVYETILIFFLSFAILTSYCCVYILYSFVHYQTYAPIVE